MIKLYKEIAKPIIVITPIFFVNLAGCINACDDIKHNRKKPIYRNLFEIGKYATAGAIFGATFPISVPMLWCWLLTKRS
jgi:hypothetical protein